MVSTFTSTGGATTSGVFSPSWSIAPTLESFSSSMSLTLSSSLICSSGTITGGVNFLISNFGCSSGGGGGGGGGGGAASSFFTFSNTTSANSISTALDLRELEIAEPAIKTNNITSMPITAFVILLE